MLLETILGASGECKNDFNSNHDLSGFSYFLRSSDE